MEADGVADSAEDDAETWNPPADAPSIAAESRPYIRLATFRTFHRVVADLNAARSLAGTLQAMVEGAVHGLGFDAAAVSLVRPDGDLVVAAVWEIEESSLGGPAVLLGQIGSRESWDRLLGVCDQWGTLRFLPHDRSWAVGHDIPTWTGDGPLPGSVDDWHPADGLLAPMYSAGGDLIGVLSVDRPHSGKRPGSWTREALEMFSLQASIAVSKARLRAEMQRALARLEKEQQALRASEESFRQAFEYAPSGMAITELHGDAMGHLTRVNDALCRLLGRPRSTLRQQRFADLVHPDDQELLQRTSIEGGRAELRLSRRDGDYQWVSMGNSVVADTAEGPSFLLTHVEDIEDRKRREFQMARWAAYDSLTGLPNRDRLDSWLDRLCRALQSDPKEAPSLLLHVRCRLEVLDDSVARYGRNALLLEVVRRLSRAAREQDLLARLSEDDFAVLAEGPDESAAQELIARIRALLSLPFTVGGQAVRLKVELGTAWARSGMTAAQVLAAAEQGVRIESTLNSVVQAGRAVPPPVRSAASDSTDADIRGQLEAAAEQIRILEDENRRLREQLGQA